MSLQPHPDDQPEPKTGRVVEITDEHMRVFRFVKDFGGLPLSALDVNQELGINERRARTVLSELEALSLLNVKVDTGNTRLYFVKEAL